MSDPKLVAMTYAEAVRWIAYQDRRIATLEAALREALPIAENASGLSREDEMALGRAKAALSGAAELPGAPLPHKDMVALCKRFVVEGEHGDYLENDGYELAREVERITRAALSGARTADEGSAEHEGS